MSSDNLALEQHDAITVLRLDRPPANALCLELAREFETVWESPEVKDAAALVLTGTGRFFSGGLDLKSVPSYSTAEQRDFLHVLNRMVARLYACPVPLVGAINGHAVAGAFVLALTTDYRVGPTGNAQFGLTEARVGIPFPAAPMIVVRAECAPQDTRYTALLAQTFGSDEARRRGVLDELQPPDAVLERALEVARDMATMPADSYRRIKHQVRRTAIAEIEEVITSGADPMLEGWFDPGAREASAARLESPARRSS
ncbi:MAG: enoyl-CoA hydratase/isomerase family protein [Myxococcota bacterium]